MSLAQFYTSESVSEHLVSFMQSESPANVLDIGCGESNLLLAAGKRWESANLIGFDIDPNNTYSTNQKLHLNLGDGLDPDLSKKIIDQFGSVDITVSNPPYLSIDFDLKAKKILTEAGLDNVVSNKIKMIPAELIFLAQNLLVMKDGGELGLILPAGLVCGEKWKVFREYITSEYSVKACIQLPNNAFKKTEASTFVLHLKKEKNDKKLIKLHQLGVKKNISIDSDRAIERMDYLYHSYVLKTFNYNVFSKFKMGAIFRGNMTDAELGHLGGKYLHTSDLNEDYKVLSARYHVIADGVKFAQKGDILIARVGSRCVGNFGYVKYGRVPISDCLFVLRVENSSKAWRLIKSKKLGEMFKASSLGVGAKYITLKMLKEVFNA